jgi:hypothetical protein
MQNEFEPPKHEKHVQTVKYMGTPKMIAIASNSQVAT